MIDTTKKPIICLMGPTASGKTNLAVQLAQHFPFEIISVDSALVYKGMDIGTAKPDKSILATAPHHLIDIRDPAEAYSAAQFRQDALLAIEAIYGRGKIPLLVGGTMLYFQTLQKGLAAMPSANVNMRAQLTADAAKLGWAALHERLAKIDPVAAARIHPNDPQRIQRALEVYLLSGKTVTDWQKEQDNALLEYHFVNIVVAPAERSVLHERIAERFRQMLAIGFIDEVKQLYERGDLSLDMPAVRSVGYRQVWEYFSGQCSYDDMQEKAIIATRQLAKRQLTWLRSWPDTIWFDGEKPSLYQEVEAFLHLLL